jgi:hypothetical protein
VPVLPRAAGNKGEPGSLPRPVALRYSSRSSSNLWWTGSAFSLPPFSVKRSKNRFPEGRSTNTCHSNRSIRRTRMRSRVWGSKKISVGLYAPLLG